MSFRKLFFLPFLLLSFLVGFFEYIGARFDLFWIVPWFDIPLHFFGGAWVVFALFPFFFRIAGQSRVYSSRPPLSIVTGVVLIVLLWEAVELALDATGVSKNEYAIDTFSDIALGIIGGFAAWKFLSKRILYAGTSRQNV